MLVEESRVVVGDSVCRGESKDELIRGSLD